MHFLVRSDAGGSANLQITRATADDLRSRAEERVV